MNWETLFECLSFGAPPLKGQLYPLVTNTFHKSRFITDADVGSNFQLYEGRNCCHPNP